MRIPIAKLPPATPLLQLPTKTQLLNNLRLGQIFPATALSENLNGNIRLRIGITNLTAQTQLSVRPGQSLLLVVKKTGPIPELKLLTQPSQKQLQASAFKQVLPRQQPLSGLFEKLIDGITLSIEKPIPASVSQEIKALLSRLPSVEKPGFRQQFREAMLQSGIFSEAHLFHGRSSGSDIKLNLLKLFALIQPLLPQQRFIKGQTTRPRNPSNVKMAEPPTLDFLTDLHKQLDGALARIQLNQLSSLPQEDPTRQVWQFELPILQGDRIDLFQIRVTREGSWSQEGKAASWDLILRMNLMPLGPMRIQLRLQRSVISTLVWSEKATTTELVTANLPNLQVTFERAGLEVKKIAAFTAKLKEEIRIPADITLLSEKA
jgi:hypothetical protein